MDDILVVLAYLGILLLPVIVAATPQRKSDDDA